MHDTQIEDRLRTVLRAEGDALPLTITPDELERRLALRRRERTGRRMSLIAAGVGVIVIGSVLAVSNGWLRSPSVGSGPSPAQSVGSGPSSAPSARAAPSEAALPCETMDPSQGGLPPALGMGVFPGDSIAYGGVRGSYGWGDTIINAYQSVDPETLDAIPAGPPSEKLVVLATSPNACLVGIDAEASPVDGAGGAVRLVATTMDPTRDVEFGLPPVGEWLIKVRADFATSPAGQAWSETYFRVVVSDPSANWAASSLPSLDSPEGTVLLEGATDFDRPGEFTDRIEGTVVGKVPPRSHYQVDFVCLGYAPMRWSIGQPVGNEFGYLGSGVQTCDGTHGTHTVDQGTPPAEFDVVVEGDPASAWRIVVSTASDEPALLAPALRMWATDNPDGARVASEAFAHCVGTDQVADACGPSWSTLDDRLNVLVQTGANVTFGLQDGWQIDEARITALAAEDIRSGANGPEYSVAFVDTRGLQQTIPVELDPGEWIAQVALNGSKDGARFDAMYYLRLYVTE